MASTIAATSWTRTTSAPLERRQRRDDRGDRPLARRRGRSSCPGTPCATCRSGWHIPGRRTVRGSARVPGCARSSCRSRCPGRWRSGRGGCRRPRPVDPAGEHVADLGDDVVVTRAACMVRGSPCMCISTTPAPASATIPGQVGVALQAADVVDDRGPGRQAPRGRPRPWSCRPRSARATRPASASTTGMTRRSSSTTGHRLGPGPARLAADVEQVGAFVDQPRACSTAAVGVEDPAAVGEAVGGDVDDPHHPADTIRLPPTASRRRRRPGPARGRRPASAGRGRRRAGASAWHVPGMTSPRAGPVPAAFTGSGPERHAAYQGDSIMSTICGHPLEWPSGSRATAVSPISGMKLTISVNVVPWAARRPGRRSGGRPAS